MFQLDLLVVGFGWRHCQRGRSRSDGDGAESDRGRSAQDERDVGVSG